MTIRGLDNYIAGGHYHSTRVEITCTNGHITQGIEWSEYGTGGLNPEQCRECREPFTEDTKVEVVDDAD